MTPHLVTVGGLTVDNVISADGTVALGRAGGNAAYSAVGALCWRERVGVVSIAVASYPRDTLDRLAANGVGLEGVAASDAVLETGDWFIYDGAGDRTERLRAPPRALAEAGFTDAVLTRDEVARWTGLLRARGQPAELSYSKFRDANPLRPEGVPASYLGAEGVHLAPSRPVVLHGMIPLFAGRGTVITLDAGAQLADERLDDLAPLLAQVDAFLPSETEVRALVPGAGPAEALAELARRCKGAVAVKLGGRGSLVWDAPRREAVAVPALETAVVDPTGAGDAYCGGFLAGLVETGDPVQAARFGTVSASLIVGCFGADGALPIDRAACRRRLGDLAAAADRARPAAATAR